MATAPPFVYVISAGRDERRVTPLVEVLRREGIPVRSSADLPLGESWPAALRQLLDEAAAVLVVWSEAASHSKSVLQELEVAMATERLLPVTLDGIDVIPPDFRDYGTLDLSGWSGSPDDEMFRLLRRELNSIMSRSQQPPIPHPAAESIPPLEFLTSSAVSVLAHADALRQAGHRAEVHMEHLLEALHEEGTAEQVLRPAGIDHNGLLTLITEVTGTSLTPVQTFPSIHEVPPLSWHAAEAIANAFASVDRAYGLSTRSLLRGVLSVASCELIQALAERGVQAPDKEAPENGASVDGVAEASGSDAAVEEQSARQHVRWVADEPVDIEGDTLGRCAVAAMLEGQLQELIHNFPGRSFLVHIDGAWGAGKSTLLRFLQELVADPKRPPASRWLCVGYDAWRQSRVGPPWLTLLQAIRSAVRENRHGWPRRMWFWLHERARLVSVWQWVALTTMVVLAAGVVLLVVWKVDGGISLTQWGDVGKLLGGLVTVVAAVWLIVRFTGQFLSLDSRRSAKAFLENRADPMEDLAGHFRWILCQAGRPVLLLVDDLDRCPESFVVELLDAVQKLMRDPHPIRAQRRQDSGEPVAFGPMLLVVVAADGRWIRQAYDNAYASLDKAVREPGATIGSLFLEKLFQLTVPVPRLPDELKRDYLIGLLAQDGGPVPERSTLDLERDVREARREQVLGILEQATAMERIQVAGVAIERLVGEPGAREETEHALQPYSPLLEPTPRAMKRFVMAYSVLRAVRTAEGSVVGTGPLALWTIVVTRWPLLAQYLQKDPAAVRLFTEPAERIAAAVPAELVPLFHDPPNDLRAVMNHEDGPLDSTTIRACSGQLIRT